MSGSIADRSTLNLTPVRPDLRAPRPQGVAADPLSLGSDQITLSKSAQEGPKSEADLILDLAIRPALEATEGKRDVFVPAPIPPLPAKTPIAIQKLKFADNLRQGRETELNFEQYPGDLTPRPQPPVFIDKDPLTGAPNLEFRELRARVSGGEYDVYLKISGDGSIGVDRIMKGGRNITSIARDAVVAKIKEDPALYGTLAAVAVAGAVAAAHEYTKRTGDPVEFDVLSTKLLQRDNFTIKGKVKAELTGDSRFVRPGSAEIAAHYGDEKLQAFAGAKYRLRDEEWEANLGANYQIDKNTNVMGGAYYRSHTKDYGAFIGLTSTF